MVELISFNQVQEQIINMRDQNVILDSDVAELYGIETKRVNEAVSNNPEKFPNGYSIALNAGEWGDLKSKVSTSSSGWGGKNKLPNVFTEKGLYMLATILKSPKATQTTIAIVETFTKIRELSRTVSELSSTTAKPKQKSLMQKSGEIIADILDNDLQISDTETSFEINLAVMKFKHIVRQKREDPSKQADEKKDAARGKRKTT
ncbi:MAG: ORF6N domain-containing protein [Spirochaetaceae bacterium]|jgi:phage regulator Rha-like protein|nr:ORF6N domain-containing protein [Spirochaetaceae bacterium]